MGILALAKIYTNEKPPANSKRLLYLNKIYKLLSPVTAKYA